MIQETFAFQLGHNNFYASPKALIGSEPGFLGDPSDEVVASSYSVIRAKQDLSCKET